jgi:uncharacterized membrane protein
MMTALFAVSFAGAVLLTLAAYVMDRLTPED